jgi:hypothetical protein
MSTLQTLLPGVALGRRRSVAAHLCVGLSFLLARLQPDRLAAMMELFRAYARPATYAEALSARQAIVTVSLMCSGEGCLQRSIATTLLCRLGGAWPTWCVGAQVDPFLAHAWVEAEGRAVDEVVNTGNLGKLVTVAPARVGR